MKFKAEVDFEVADHDADLCLKFPDAISDRFAGTGIRITYISVSKEDEKP